MASSSSPLLRPRGSPDSPCRSTGDSPRRERAAPSSRSDVTSQFSLDGRTAVVTGASRNIGASIATAFADAGADVVLVARGAEQLESTAARLRASYPDRRIEAHVADVSNREAVDELVSWTHREVGSVDILVNNAALLGTPGGGTPAVD